MKTVTVRQELKNGDRYPAVIAKFEFSDDNVVRGTLTYWKDGNTKEEKEHKVDIGYSLPLGLIFVDFDAGPGGAWRYRTFEGTDITHRDLQWVTLWAIEVLNDWKSHFET